jgi:hypothetical protein
MGGLKQPLPGLCPVIAVGDILFKGKPSLSNPSTWKKNFHSIIQTFW